MSMNKWIGNGRLCSAPELKQTPNGVAVATFSIACRKKQDETHFFQVVAWRGAAEFVARYFKKGDGICIDGHLNTREYTDKNGSNHKVIEIVADNVSFPDGKKAEDVDIHVDKPAEQQKVTELQDDGDLPF